MASIMDNCQRDRRRGFAHTHGSGRPVHVPRLQQAFSYILWGMTCPPLEGHPERGRACIPWTIWLPSIIDGHISAWRASAPCLVLGRLPDLARGEVALDVSVDCTLGRARDVS